METTPETKIAVKTVPLPDFERLVAALGHSTRWKMLKELGLGEPRSIAEMAKVAGCSYENAVKHLGRLRAAGLIVQGRGRLYQMPAHFIPTPGQPLVDFGHCTLRLDAGK
jgi:predicted transcriptional regulator